MTVTPLPLRGTTAPDADVLQAQSAPPASDFSRALTSAVATTAGALQNADAAERAFVAGRGGLQEMMLQRAQADVALSVASAAATRAAQSLTTILGMQV